LFQQHLRVVTIEGKGVNVVDLAAIDDDDDEEEEEEEV